MNKIKAEKAFEKDLEFLHILRTGTVEEIKKLEKNNRHKSAPEWKRIAISRELARRNIL